MEVVKYSGAYAADLSNILEGRALSQDWGKGLPENSYFVQHDGKMLAFMCMRHIEGGMGILETAVTDAKASPELRHEAMDILSNFLVKRAQQLGFIGLLFVTGDKNTILRGVKHGGDILDKVVVSRYFDKA